MAGARRRGELRVELTPDEPRVVGKLDHLAQPFARGEPADPEARRLEPRQVMVVYFVAVTVALDDALGVVDRRGEGLRGERTFLSAEPHRSAEVGLHVAALDAAVAILPFCNQRDHRMRRFRLEFGAVRALEPHDVARVLDYREL